MSRPHSTHQRSVMGFSVCLTAALALGACALIPWVAIALYQEDIEAVESPLVLSVARQLELGPGSLYGPYGGAYPLVLIHAPLYYRLAALAGWPLYRAGVDPVTASLAAGRLVSGIGLLVTLVAAYRLARLDGLPRRAGGWAALLIVATPVCSAVMLEVRPDMLGIGLQTTGILLVLSGLVALPIAEARLTLAFVCFALAACIKQHFVMAPLVSLVLMAGDWARGRLGLASIIRCLAIAVATVVLYYGAEEWITAGRMSRSTLVALASVGKVHPADWFAAGNLFLALVWKCVGVILLFSAAGLAMVSTRPGMGRRALVAVGVILIGLVAALTVIQFVQVQRSVSQLIVLGLILVIFPVIPACARLERSFRGGSLDAALWTYAACEMVFAAILWRLSTGAWFNYALQAVVIVCVLTARALARAYDGATSWRTLFPVGLAALAVPAFAFTDVKQIVGKRRAETAGMVRLLEAVKRPATEIFFVDLPGANRVHGRLDLVYDPWLYPVFESIGLAEPRSIWLERALVTGPVRIVATTSSLARIDGLKRSLPELGYRLSRRIGPYFVWAR